MSAARPPVTSHSLRQVANQLRSSRHPLLFGSVGDLVLLQGRALPLGTALERMACSSFAIVLRLNAADGLTVVKGEDAFRCLGDGSCPPAGAEDAANLPERERRVRNLRQTRRADAEDPVMALRRALAQNTQSVGVIVEQADILLQDPAQHDQPDRVRVAGLQLALREAAQVGVYRNTCFLVAGQSGSIPPVLLAGCEDVAMVSIEAPKRDERAAYIAELLPSMHGSGELQTGAARRAVADELAMLTDGDSLRAISSLAAFSTNGKHSVLDPRALVRLHRYGDRADYWRHLRPRLAACEALLARRVFGQPDAIRKVMDIIAAAAMGLDLSGNPLGCEGQPRGVLWFVGSTGVGKTEMAKAIAEAIFGDPESYMRLDMSTFAQEHSAERLMGAPPGYVGFEQGGELTNAVRRRPNLVILLDEIEKAHPGVLDRIISILDEGRVTDAQGRVTYFGETVIIATSNVGAAELSALLERTRGTATYAEVRDVAVSAVERHFLSLPRPEILGRIANGIVAFDILRDEMIDQIATKFVEAAVFTNGPQLKVDVPTACAMARHALQDPAARALGGRQVRNVLQNQLRGLASWLARNGHAEAGDVRVHFEDQSMFASVDGTQSRRVA